MSQHAMLSPSSAHRWLHCPASVPLTRTCKDDASPFADEGTVAHTVAADALRSGSDASAYVGERHEINGRTWEVTAEMAASVQEYVDYVRAIAGVRLVEQPLRIASITGEQGAQGTADVVILAGDALTIVDLKYGKGVKVLAEGNEQLQLYALAALSEFGWVEDFQQVRLVIVQPRLGHADEWVRTLPEMEDFKQRVKRSATRCMEAIGHYTNVGELPSEYFGPAETPCRFCKAKATCPALATHVLTTVADDFVDLTQPVAPQLSHAALRTFDNTTLASLFGATELIDSWCKAVRAKAAAELRSGNAVPGYKLVQGRQGPRRWVDETAAEDALIQMRIGVAHMYDMSLISPTSAEKLHQAGVIGDHQWPKLQPLIHRTPGAPVVVPTSDQRPPLALQDATDFEDLSDMPIPPPQDTAPSLQSQETP
ncbi:hypothetical protein AA93_02865 [Xylella fastidiosa subsp. pauca 11399]|uniref:DUF2800 domain-containing protein n=1 Tax=Xylella fastidiosa TaxID=2371 RepID=UPI00080AE28E|nr:DUF2800 domain-containing protein [Xylella fastidiosa]OCA58617.1 hypothetical protein AA93_02865 [Xylella fastidiosa subsp. pauca 11399]